MHQLWRLHIVRRLVLGREAFLCRQAHCGNFGARNSAAVQHQQRILGRSIAIIFTYLVIERSDKYSIPSLEISATMIDLVADLMDRVGSTRYGACSRARHSSCFEM